MTIDKTAATKQKPESTQKQGEPEETFEPILDLDTLAPKRSTVRIRTEKDREGALYEMRLPEELGIEEDQRFRSELREFGKLMGEDGLTSAQRKRLVTRVDQLCRKVLDAPNEVHEALNDSQRKRLITRFTSALFVEDASALPDLTEARVIGSIMES